MRCFWGRSIRDKWCSRLKTSAASCFLIFWLSFAFIPAASAVTSAKSTKKAKSTTTAPKPKAAGGAGLLAIAQRELEDGNYDAASKYAKDAASKVPALEDYAQFIREQAVYNLKDYREVDKSAAKVFENDPPSPLSGQAAAFAVKADLQNDQPKAALELIRRFYARISQPQADFLLAQCFRANGDFPQAAEYFQRVYYGYPLSKDAQDANEGLAELKTRLGDSYPPPTATAMLARANKLMDAKKYGEARAELESALPALSGPQRDLARVRVGEAQLLHKDAPGALSYLRGLHVDDPDADAERLDYIIRAARKVDKAANVRQELDQLAQAHPNSMSRLEALIFVANQSYFDNEPAVFLPLYQACASGFPTDTRASVCHWRLAFDSYWKNQPDAFDLLREHVKRYPDSDDANGALYFLGRFSERQNNPAAAHAYYTQLLSVYPNTYYAVIARDRMKAAQVNSTVSDPKAVEFLQSVSWPSRPQVPSFTPEKTVQKRIERAQLLSLADLDDWADGELKFGAKNDTLQPHVYAFELAKHAAARDEPDQAIRYIKAYAPGYLYYPFESAPVAFWHLAFPIPYRAPLEQRSRERSLDPFLVAALIRQESEFNVKIISYANAYGLMQVLPSTGRDLARKLGIRGYSKAQLLTADRNLQLGTYYFKNLLDSFDGQPEPALASYNAGKSRADTWLKRGTMREPAEFVETIAFQQTHGYVETVMRNADTYRRLYSGKLPDLPPTPPKKTATTKATRKKK
jgi:soluble lytic murein transglycosylase